MTFRPSTSNGGRSARSVTPDLLTRVHSSFDPPFDCATSAAYGSWYYEEASVDPELIGYPPNSISNVLKRLPTPLNNTYPPVRAEQIQRNEIQSAKIRSEKLDNVYSPCEKKTILNFGGWYTGKTSGKIGTTNIHRQPSIATADPAHTWKG